jgi:RNA polymerase sigma factor (sigma-70 family)
LNLENLIKGCVKQNRLAQEELYNLYKKTLYVLSLKYCTNEAEAEDNLHNSFIAIFTNIKKFNNKGSFEGWMKRITINKAIDTYKKKYQLIVIQNDFIEDTTIDEDELEFSLDYILSLIQQLPHQYRLVFNLYELDNYSHQEIAQMLTITESTSKSNLHRAKAILKEKIRSNNSFHKYSVKNGK